jgi:predicted nucleic acid-binding protein
VAVIIADSDVLIDFLRGTQGGAKRFAEEMGKATLTTTAITAFEVRAGAHSAKQKRAIELTRNLKHFARIERLKLAEL